jgi:excisionase family DNA binding protein
MPEHIIDVVEVGKPKRGRPRKYETPEAARAAIETRKADRAAEREHLKAIRRKDQEAAKQPAIRWLLVTIRQASEALQVSERTVYSLIDTGALEAVRIGGARRICFDSVRRLATTGASLPTVAERDAAKVTA